jgi:predicted metal-dependent hydrolase
MDLVQIGDKEFRVEIEKKRVRYLRLRVKEKNKISVSCPWFLGKEKVIEFILKNKEWILRENEKIKKKINVDKKKNISILGNKFKILVDENIEHRPIIDRDKNIIYAKTKTALMILLKREADRLIKKEVDNLAAKYNKIRLRQQKTRWGSCSGRGNLNFNWQIIFFPYEKFFHIIVHEVVHLKIKNHKKEFWLEVAKYDENWKKNRKWIKEKGATIF